jgi:hypothetical protein
MYREIIFSDFLSDNSAEFSVKVDLHDSDDDCPYRVSLKDKQVYLNNSDINKMVKVLKSAQKARKELGE